MGRQRMDVRPPDGFYDLPKDQQLEWIEAFIAEASARMDAMPDDEVDGGQLLGQVFVVGTVTLSRTTPLWFLTSTVTESTTNGSPKLAA